MCHAAIMTDSQDGTAAAEPGAYQVLPTQITLAETSTTHDTSATDTFGSLGAISATSPLVAIGPEGGDGD